MKVRDIHASGYHSATREQWDDLGALIAARADVGALTECRVKCASDEWVQYVPANELNAAECSIMWDGKRFTAQHKGHDWITTRKFRTGSGAVRPGVVATWVILFDRDTMETLLRIVAHMPASVQRGDSFGTKTARNVAWVSGRFGLWRLTRRLRRLHKPDEITVSADWNTDLKRRTWRARISRPLPRAGRRLRLLPPNAGTHGRRAIDGHVSTMRGDVRVLGGLKGFDHDPVLAVLQSRPKRKKKS